MDTRPRLLLFGASGAIGTVVAARALAAGWCIVPVYRGAPNVDVPGAVRYDPLDDPGRSASGDVFAGHAPFDAICWAQGANFSDTVAGFDPAAHLDLYRANVLSVLVSMAMLVERGLLSPGGARLVVVSSIWQERARQNKLSYTVTKAAVGGLVRSASVDLGARGHLVNAVLPGVLDTPMTAANLTPAQVEMVKGKSGPGRLPDLASLVDTILFLCSSSNNSINGQSIAVDLGMNNANLF